MGTRDRGTPHLPAKMLRTLHPPPPPPRMRRHHLPLPQEDTVTDTLTCITNALPDFRGCTIRDEHHTDYPDMAAHYATCNGCVQRPTFVGFVCAPCYHRIEEALRELRPWHQLLAGVDRAIQSDPEGGGKPGSRLPIAPVPLTMEELASYRRSFTGSAERWVSDRAGATDAVRYARAAHTALKQHPTAETPHNINRTRCPNCEQQTLVWNPPAYYGADVRVTCRNPECDYEADQTTFDTIADIEGTTGRTISRQRIEHRDQGDHCECGTPLPTVTAWDTHIRATLQQEEAA